MKPSTWLTRLVLLVLLVLKSTAAAEITKEFVSPGGDVTLKCKADHGSITAVEWTRVDLPDNYVLLYRDGHSDPTLQLEAFKGRVQLVDGDLRDGDASLLLKDVSDSDAGTYECRVAVPGSSRFKRAIIDDDPITSINLEVKGPLLWPGLLAAAAVVLVACVSGVVLWKRKRAAAGQIPLPSGGSEEPETPKIPLV